MIGAMADAVTDATVGTMVDATVSATVNTIFDALQLLVDNNAWRNG